MSSLMLTQLRTLQQTVEELRRRLGLHNAVSTTERWMTMGGTDRNRYQFSGDKEIGVKLDEPLPDLSWIYMPFPEQGPANRITYYSNYAPANAPAGHGSFLAEVTHRGDLRPDQAWMDDLLTRLETAGILRREQVVLSEWCNNTYAYIHQDLEFADRIARVREWWDNSGYISFGRFGR